MILLPPRCRTELFRNSCIPSSVSIWNNLDENIRNSSSLASFKYALKQTNTNKVPAYYIKGDRYLSVMHARIRNKCSNLNNDLYLNHLRIKPLCSCHMEIENAEHYFFRCPIFGNERITLFHETHNFHPLNLNTLTHGSDILSTEDNTCIFKAVHKFIKNAQRFSQNR